MVAKRHEINTILIIEDEADVRNFASRVLELEGYRVLGVETSEEGLRLAREDNVALVLLDLRLPGEDGWAFLTRLKRKAKLSAIPVVVFTASAGELQRNRALAAGAVDFLVKPLSASDLRKAVARILYWEE